MEVWYIIKKSGFKLIRTYVSLFTFLNATILISLILLFISIIIRF